MATPIYLQRRARRGPTFREALLMHAVGRIAYRGAIDNIQVELGEDGRRGRHARCCGPGRQRPRRHAHGREHLRAPRAPATASGWRSRRWPSWSSRSADPLEQRTTLYGRPPRAGPDVSDGGRVGRPSGPPPRADPSRTPLAVVPPTIAPGRAARPRRSSSAALDALAGPRPAVAQPGQPAPLDARLDLGDDHGGHERRRPEDRRRRAGRDGRGVPGLPPLPRRAEGHHVRLGPHPARRPALPAGPRPGRATWPRPGGWW